MPVSNFKAIGQNGKVIFEKDTLTNTSIPFDTTESFIRFQYKTADGVLFYLSPLFRYEGKFPTKQAQYNQGVKVDSGFMDSLKKRLPLFVFFLLIIYFINRRKRN